MTDWLMMHEGYLRFTLYLGVLILMLLLEQRFSARPPVQNKLNRWLNNIAIAWTGAILARIAIPSATVATAVWASAHNIGLFPWLKLSEFVAIPLGIICLDLAIYWQHRLFHAVPWLWRIHALHHADRDVDASTAGRFHPLEILFSLCFKTLLIIVLGCSPICAIAFTLLLNTSATFNHSNITLPRAMERLLRLAIVTPSVHRIHHSADPQETNSNFGFFLLCWDRLFKSYRHSAKNGEQNLLIGLDLNPAFDTTSLTAQLTFPWHYRPR